MKKLFVVLILLLSVSLFADVNKFQELENYPIGFWNYVYANNQDKSAVRDWKDLGMSVAISPYYDSGCNKAQFIELLDECEKNNIKVILYDVRGQWNTLKKGEAEYRKQFGEALKDFGSHPAVLGFHIGDEPNRADLDYCLNACKIQKEMAPNLSPYFNLIPWSDTDDIRNHTGFQTLEEYADYICENSPCQVFAYDCYSQMKKDDSGLDNYFNNLYRFNKVAIKHNLPLWNTILGVGHFDYKCPNMDEMRWQLNTSVAHGANGILWFFLYNRNKESNYRYAAIDEFGQRTQTFENMRYENNKLKYCYDKLIPKLRLKEVYHTYKSYGGVPLFKPNDVVKEYTNNKSLPGIISFFNDGYVAVVNNSMSENVYVSLTFDDSVQKASVILDYGNESEVFPNKTSYYNQNGKNIEFWLAPGGMEIFKLMKDFT